MKKFCKRLIVSVAIASLLAGSFFVLLLFPDENFKITDIATKFTWFGFLSNKNADGQISTFELDEHDDVVLFVSYAYQHKVNEQDLWKVKLRGFVFDKQKAKREWFLLHLAEWFGNWLVTTSTDEERSLLKETLQLFVSRLGESFKQVKLRLGSKEFSAVTDKHGYFNTQVSISNDEVQEYMKESGAHIPYYASTPDGEKREGYLQFIRADAKGLSVISDIDDTIKLTEISFKLETAKNTFIRAFKAINHMNELYKHWMQETNNATMFHYVSSSPNQLYTKLEQFLKDHHFPQGSIHLKPFNLFDWSVLNLFKSPMKHKPAIIREIIEKYPNRQFILVGDSSERDPEIYAKVHEEFSSQVKYIFIRCVCPTMSSGTIDQIVDCEKRCTKHEKRYLETFKNVPTVKWQVFTDPKQLMKITIH